MKIKIPLKFYIDHYERGLPTPEDYSKSKTYAVIDTEDSAFNELMGDAEFYADPFGPDSMEGFYPRRQCPIKRAAKSLIKAVERQT